MSPTVRAGRRWVYAWSLPDEPTTQSLWDAQTDVVSTHYGSLLPAAAAAAALDVLPSTALRPGGVTGPIASH